MTTYVDKALAKRESGHHVPFVTWSVPPAHRGLDPLLRPGHLGLVVTLTRDGDAVSRRGRPDVAGIGYTWLEPSAQRSPINTEAKLMMMTYAFEAWEVRVVRIQTDARNIRSRRAIERLGCSLDGIIRAERPAADGGVRDTAVYSMLDREWPIHRRG